MGNPQPTDLSWLAGIWDGEGSILMVVRDGQTPRKYEPVVCVANTDHAMIVAILKIFLDLDCRCHVSVGWRPKSTKEVWTIRVQRLKEIQKLLGALIPYLVAKRAKAELVKRWVDIRLQRTAETAKAKHGEDEILAAEHIRRLNDLTQDDEETSKIKSELRGKLVELAEMANRLTKVRS